MSHLCLCCAAVFQKHHELPPQPDEPFKFGYGKHVLYEDVQLFLDAVEAGCVICIRLYREVRPKWWTHMVQDLLDVKKKESFVTHGASFKIEFALTTLNRGMRVDFKLIGWLFQSKSFREVTLPIRISPAADVADPALPNTLGTSTGEGPAWRTARQWLTRCSQSHGMCGRDAGSFKPTRLIFIGDDSSPARLCDSADLSPTLEYTSLSHRWGKVMILRLLTTNKRDFKEELPLQEFPTTFLDAIEFTRYIGLQYIWIDSLCIIQDDVDDWRQEAARMGDVYRFSYCNIAATGFEDSKRGMLVRRDPSLVAPLLIKRNCEYPKGKLPFAVQAMPTAGGPVFDPPMKFRSHAREHARRQQVFPDGQYVCFYDRFWNDAITNAPLSSRGWVFQERLLSPRTIHFGTEQLFWECREAEACETFPLGLPRHFHEGSTYKSERAVSDLDDAVEDETSLQTAMSAWNAVLASYTAATLTKQSDRLPALSGVAKDMQKVLRSKYVCGLWERFFVYQLLWRLEVPDTPDVITSGAPSWSWAATAGRVIGSTSAPTAELSKVCQILDVQVESLSDEMGEVSVGTICVSGVLVHLFPTPKRFDIREYGQKLEDTLTPFIFFWPYGTREYTTYSSEVQGKRNGVEIDPVIHMDRNPWPEEVYLLPLLARQDCAQGLVVVPVDLNELGGPWKRCGMFEFTSDLKGASSFNKLIQELGKSAEGQRTIYIS